MASGLPVWRIPTTPSGWEADDLDHLPQAPCHTELLDGVLVFRSAPQRYGHTLLVEGIIVALRQAAPEGVHAAREMTVRLDKWADGAHV